MTITIRTAGALKERLSTEMILSNLTDGQTVGDAVTQLDLPADMGLVMMVNGKLAHWGTELHEGDVLQLVPVIGGG